eukprot:g8245.t1
MPLLFPLPKSDRPRPRTQTQKKSTNQRENTTAHTITARTTKFFWTLFGTTRVCCRRSCDGEGTMQYNGLDFPNALSAFKEAAELGYVEGMNNLGLCYFSRIGVSKNKELALSWLRTASCKSNPMAMSCQLSPAWMGWKSMLACTCACGAGSDAATRTRLLSQHNQGSGTPTSRQA